MLHYQRVIHNNLIPLIVSTPIVWSQIFDASVDSVGATSSTHLHDDFGAVTLTSFRRVVSLHAQTARLGEGQDLFHQVFGPMYSKIQALAYLLHVKSNLRTFINPC
jgi:hypothetical protein